MKVFFFGSFGDGHCWYAGDRGHSMYLSGQGNHKGPDRWPGRESSSVLTGKGWKIDGGYLPKNLHLGQAVLTHENGWTILSFWDCTGDTRPGSNSNFVVEGEFTFEDVMLHAREQYPSLFKRFNFAVVDAT